MKFQPTESVELARCRLRAFLDFWEANAEQFQEDFTPEEFGADPDDPDPSGTLDLNVICADHREGVAVLASDIDLLLRQFNLVLQL